MKGSAVKGGKKKPVDNSSSVYDFMEEEEADFNENDSSDIFVSKNCFDMERMGPIDSDTPVIDEIQSFIDAVMDTIRNGTKQKLNEMFGQILQFYATLAYEAVYVLGEMKVADHALVMVSTYQSLVQNLHMKEGYNDVFFSKWPGGTLPEEYLSWVDQKYEHGVKGKDESLNIWIQKEAPKHVAAPKDTKLKLHFGYTLMSLAQEAFRDIRKFHNRYYVAPENLASGKNMTGMFRAMKKQLLKVYAQLQGYNTLTHRKEWKENVWDPNQKSQELFMYRTKKLEIRIALIPIEIQVVIIVQKPIV
jgi:hypothetical protein